MVSQILICTIWLVLLITNAENALPSKESKIAGGSSININEAKYQISLRLISREISMGLGHGHICGGSVIAQRSILTAAHCVVNYVAKDLGVVMGNANRFATDPLQLQYYVQEIVKHQSYNTSTDANDIALLFINGYIPWNWPTVQAVQLNTQQTAINSLCTISGWGKMTNGRLSANLLAASVPLISYEQCSYNYGFIPHSMICAGNITHGGMDACQGDSGGPFVCNRLLTGIISWGDRCALPDRPGVYTNVSAFHDWIVKTNNSFNYTSYDSATDLSLNIFLITPLAIRLLYLLQ